MSIIKLDSSTYFSTDDGIVLTEDNALRLIQKAALHDGLTVGQKFVHVRGKDTVNIALQLVGRNQAVPPQKGFLITVYLQDPNTGALTRLYKSPIVDPADQTIVRGTFEDYIYLDTDT